MKIRLLVSQWPGQAINCISRFAQSFDKTYEFPVGEHEANQEELHNNNVDKHEDVMNYR